MKWNTKIAPVVCLAVLGTAIEARADCQNLRGAVTVVITTPPPNTTSLDIFVTSGGDMLTAVGFPVRTPIPGAPAGEFSVHVDLTISGEAGKCDGASGTMTFDGFSHAGGPGVGTAELVYRGSVCGPNLKAGE